MSEQSLQIGGDTSSMPLKKRRRHDVPNEDCVSDSPKESLFCPENTHLVSVLHNDSHSKSLILHVRFGEDDSKDSIMILKKSSFPGDSLALKDSKVINRVLTNENIEHSSNGHKNDVQLLSSSSSFPNWKATTIMKNDIYNCLSVTSGLELVNGIDMTIIYPAESHHFKKYSPSACHIIHETPDIYREITVPFLSEKPKDLTWIDNIISGEAEQDRVLYSNPDPIEGFTVVLDYKWDELYLNELHYLGIVNNPNLTCLRDLRSSHIPLLKEIREIGCAKLVSKYSGNLIKDQLIIYLHYHPTFYRLHVHFNHVNSHAHAGTRVGVAHLLDEVIRNLEQNDGYYATRTMTIYLRDNNPVFQAIQLKQNKDRNLEDSIYSS